MKLQPPRGMRDLGPQEASIIREVTTQLDTMARLYGYSRVETPTLEYETLFTTKSGEAIVQQLYTLEDKSGRRLALRPDVTPPLTRHYLDRYQSAQRPVRLCAAERVYRYEAPQAGRYREIRQFNVEQFGGAGVACDAEVVAHFVNSFRSISLNPEVLLGDRRILTAVVTRLLACPPETTPHVIRILDKADKLPAGEIAQELRKTIPMAETAGLDALIEFAYVRGGIREALPSIRALLPVELVTYWEELAVLLDAACVYDACTFRPGLARGFDYYNGILMEATLPDLGLLGAVGGGGRYDDLTTAYGGAPVPSIGFSIGLDRVMAALLDAQEESDRPEIVVAATDADGLPASMRIASRLRLQGKQVELVYQARSARKHEDFARRRGVGLAIISTDGGTNHQVVADGSTSSFPDEEDAQRAALETLS